MDEGGPHGDEHRERPTAPHFAQQRTPHSEHGEAKKPWRRYGDVWTPELRAAVAQRYARDLELLKRDALDAGP